MSNDEIDLDDIERRMKGAVEALRHEFAGLRTGRATTSLLDPVVVDVYGASMPLNQVGTVTVPEPRMLSVQVWDKANGQAVEKAIRNAGLGLNPMLDGQLVRIPIPELNEERRAELAKVAAKYAEQGRIAIRNVRRDGMDTLKRQEKDKSISEDDHKMYADEVQELTNQYVASIDETLQAKEAEIMQV
ncbi:ribosome recycling factor [Kordiimonas aquimaris]|uniref:ribosome recycling factor n=1 Tax=Kordiimonas aquimaris TaxID=707591 RepID=UPI0021D28807|nr:ribosome recycling factor [Kordiimonas aquimaris]